MGNICPLHVGIKTCITVMEINMDVQALLTPHGGLTLSGE